MSDKKMTTGQAPRDGYDLWDKVCEIPSYGFIHSQDNARVLKVRDIGSWIDRDVVLAIVEQAQYELNELRQAITITAHSSFEEALMEIAGMKNLTATPAQFIRHLQLTAANALLAASPEPVAQTAAPDLLDALEQIADYIEERIGDNECRPLENARAAIAKAKGEQQ